MNAAGRRGGWVHVKPEQKGVGDQRAGGTNLQKIHREMRKGRPGWPLRENPAASLRRPVRWTPPERHRAIPNTTEHTTGFQAHLLPTRVLLTTRRKYQNKSLVFVWLYVAEDEPLWPTAAGRAAESSAHTHTHTHADTHAEIVQLTLTSSARCKHNPFLPEPFATTTCFHCVPLIYENMKIIVKMD